MLHELWSRVRFLFAGKQREDVDDEIGFHIERQVQANVAAGMSPEETRAMMELIVKLATDRTVILVEHKMKLVMGISDRLIVLHHGELLAEGSPADIRTNDLVKRVYLGQREH